MEIGARAFVSGRKRRRHIFGKSEAQGLPRQIPVFDRAIPAIGVFSLLYPFPGSVGHRFYGEAGDALRFRSGHYLRPEIALRITDEIHRKQNGIELKPAEHQKRCLNRMSRKSHVPDLALLPRLKEGPQGTSRREDLFHFFHIRDAMKLIEVKVIGSQATERPH